MRYLGNIGRMESCEIDISRSGSVANLVEGDGNLRYGKEGAEPPIVELGEIGGGI